MSNPYQPPAEPNSTVNLPLGNQYTYQSLETLTAMITALLAIGIAVSIAEAISSFWQLDLLDRIRSGLFYTLEEVSANDARQISISWAALVIYIVTAIVFGIWIVRAHRNLYALQVTGLSFTPGAAVGWFFVPFLNLVRPFQAMKELWQASHAGDYWEKSDSANLVNIWWFFWLVTCIYGWSLSRFYASPNDIDEVILATKAGIGGALIHILLCFLALKLIRKIRHAQEALVDAPSLVESYPVTIDV